ncbi:MAG: GNAT family N-acetyltransferase [Rhodobacteraceae bacterium]|uniref:L-2,4-diaminobutyric acid acetyltransferase n=1 Tax=Falsiruegeria mediterranea M17 TaxID=1200281 RepID=A0A2R8C5R0_9RHOB|nr:MULTISPECIES: GNAT family N-acetyltransferase [Roseobacteraceae]MBE1282839.1 GNAT family N-acetyltransferase [Paracoccaceae bacterium]MBO9452775.1 GNAT family N-acetyltransferase [Tropicibacter sp. R16_0]SPJ27696.1 L-2,4-diaminobutyric acid acetyltransferase [Falsiruegeria mediterranea M17]
MKHSLELFEQPIPTLRAPQPEDGERVALLAKDDRKQAFGELLGELSDFEQFMNTSIVAEVDGEVVGAVLAYVPPYAPNTLNILQVVIHENEENKGLGSLMLGQLMRRKVCAEITQVETTISACDDVTWALFRRFARWQRSRMEITPFFTQALQPRRRHENDNQVTIQLAGETNNPV